MTYTLTANDAVEIKLAPESLVEEILQNITTILSTYKNSVPLDRNFGLSARFLDKPLPVAEAILVTEVLDAIEEYEPRAEFLDISFERNGINGKIIPRLEVAIHDG